jgi:hypothetical protein
MNPFEMVIGIVLIVTIGSILRARYGVTKDRDGNDVYTRGQEQSADVLQLREEVRALRERIQVLERVITDNEGGLRLDREIEALRNPSDRRQM